MNENLAKHQTVPVGYLHLCAPTLLTSLTVLHTIGN